MSEIEIRASASSYPVTIARESWASAIRDADFVVVDEYFRDRLDADVSSRAVFIEASEVGKSLQTCEEVLVRLHEMGARRGAVVAALGGGVIQDVTTLVASLYMRGLPWIYVPTTAMAMTDSCIGGKSSINLRAVKNLVGNIYPPVSVQVDSSLACSLERADKVAGLAEAVKICFARGTEAFQGYLAVALAGREFGDDERTDAIIRQALTAKKWFVEIDEFDQCERQLLNFGHTFAHALEPAVAFAIPHGVAVALGVLAALEHPRAVEDDGTCALRDYCRALVAEVPECAVAAWDRFDAGVFASSIASDKKSTNAELRFVLPQAAGGLAIVGVDRSDAAIDEATDAMRRVLEVCAP